MQECFSRYPTVYNKTGGDDDDDGAMSSSNGDVFGSLEANNVDTVDQVDESVAVTDAGFKGEAAINQITETTDKWRC